LFSRHGLHPRLQAIKLLASLTYPLKITKGQCGWHLELEHLELLLESGDRRCPLLKLEVLLLDGMLEMYNHMGAGVHLLTSEV
jgi:hypothetical protein